MPKWPTVIGFDYRFNLIDNLTYSYETNGYKVTLCNVQYL